MIERMTPAAAWAILSIAVSALSNEAPGRCNVGEYSQNKGNSRWALNQPLQISIIILFEKKKPKQKIYKTPQTPGKL